jgi:hypothetical protein
LRSLCKEFGGTASDFEGYFTSSDPAEQLAQVIIKKLRILLGDQQPQSLPQTKETADKTDPLAPASEMPNPMVINTETGKVESPLVDGSGS